MIVVFGRRPYGRVEVSEGTFILTEFVHLWYLPIAPTRSHVVLSRDKTGLCQNLPIPMHGVSVLAAYIRTWGTVGAGAFLVAALAASDEGWMSALPLLVCAAGLVAAVVVAWTKLGKLPPAELARRRIYARFAGVAVDVGLLGGHGEGLFKSLEEAIRVQGKALLSGTYRTVHDPAGQWAEVALDPSVLDRTFLETCLTLARMEWSRATGPERLRLADVHRRLWKRLSTELPASPPVLAGAVEASGEAPLGDSRDSSNSRGTGTGAAA
jgi:hypothetical protein